MTKTRSFPLRFRFSHLLRKSLTLSAPIPQSGQTHSNNLSLPTNCLIVLDHFMGLVLEGLMENIILCTVLLATRMTALYVHLMTWHLFFRCLDACASYVLIKNKVLGQ